MAAEQTPAPVDSPDICQNCGRLICPSSPCCDSPRPGGWRIGDEHECPVLSPRHSAGVECARYAVAHGDGTYGGPRHVLAETPGVRPWPTEPDPGCRNCDGIGCMGCRTRTVHDECVHDCPSCRPAEVDGLDPVVRARRRTAADEVRKALATRLGTGTLGPLDSATDLPWLLDTGRRVLAAVDALDREQEPTLSQVQAYLRRAGLRLEMDVETPAVSPDSDPTAADSAGQADSDGRVDRVVGDAAPVLEGDRHDPAVEVHREADDAAPGAAVVDESEQGDGHDRHGGLHDVDTAEVRALLDVWAADRRAPQALRGVVREVWPEIGRRLDDLLETRDEAMSGPVSAPSAEDDPDGSEGGRYFADLQAEYGRCTCPVGECYDATGRCALCRHLDDGWPCPTVEHHAYPGDTSGPSAVDCPDWRDGPECDHPPRVGGACRPCAVTHSASHRAAGGVVPPSDPTTTEDARG